MPPTIAAKAPPLTLAVLRAERARLMAEVDPRFLAALTKYNGPIPDPTRTLGWRWTRWIRKACRMGEGDMYGLPPKLAAWQELLFWKLAELETDGRRRFSFALLSFGKGAGKSPMSGWVGSIDLAGPAVLCPGCQRCAEGWTPEGLPHGARRTSPDVIAIAASYEQSGLIFDEVKATFELGPLASDAEVGVATIALKARRGKFRRLHATPKKVDGTKATTLLVDELHEFTTEMRTQAYDVASGGTAKRVDGLVLVTTTAGFDMSSLLGRLVSRGVAGKFARHEMFLYMLAEGADLDHKRWAGMLAEGRDAEVDEQIGRGILMANPLAQAGIARIAPLISKFKEMPLFRALRYYWNQWTTSDESWLPVGAWDACKGEVVLNPEWRTWVGADMALTRDSAAVVVVQLRPDGKYQAHAKIWYPSGVRIDQSECDDYIRGVNLAYSVEWVAADEAWWPTLGDLEKEGVSIFRMPQQGRNMIMAYTQLYRRVVDRIIVHDGSPDFSDQIASAVPASSDRGWTLKKGKHQKKIDSCPALAGAVFASTLEPPEVEAPLPESEIF